VTTTFRITHHSGFAAPADALDLLWQRLDGNRAGGARFAKANAGIIRAVWAEDVPLSMERCDREEVGRRVVLNIVCDICSRVPELKSDWFAVSPLR
jgi:hypothetical protein